MRIKGNVIIVDNVACPEASSNAEPVKPCAEYSACAESIQPPIKGWKIEVESIPTPPIMDIPKAPLNGTRCATKPITVGQLKHTPKPNITAAK